MTTARSILLLLLVAAVIGTERVAGTSIAAGQEAEETTRPDIRVLEIRSDVRYRYARTEVFSKIANPSDESQEVTFNAILPEAAFISGLAITQDDVVTHALVQGREQARETFQAAVAAGHTAARAEENARDARLFTVTLSVAARSKAAFNLTYEQLLVRERGRYRLRHMLDPGQVVQQMLVEVRIRDSKPLSLVRAASLRAMDNEVDPGEEGPDESLATVERSEVGEAVIRWQPDADAQRNLGDGSGAGLNGLLEIQYDVERTSGTSELVVGDGGYFVHFFSPPESDLTPLPKHVVFVLDTSGSMYGSKITQLKEAMAAILSELRDADAFSLVLFSSGARVWSPSGGLTDYNVESLPSDAVAPQSLVLAAQETVNGTFANGGTHMWVALQAAFALVRAGRAQAPNRQPLVFFLTDGEPNGPRSTTPELEDAVKTAEADPASAAPLYSLAFGRDADFAFLRRLSLRGRGFARRVYEAADAALQLRNLYATVASPLLANVTFQYADGQVENGTLTRSAFPVQLAGGELVVAGRLSATPQEASTAEEAGAEQTSEDSLQARVIGDAASRPNMTSPAVTRRLPPQSAPFMERLWAYLTVRQLLERAHGDDAAARARAEQLALRYSFVTPLTSLVAVAPAGAEARTSLRDVVPGSRGADVASSRAGLHSIAQAPASFSGGAAMHGMPGPVDMMASSLVVPHPGRRRYQAQWRGHHHRHGAAPASAPQPPQYINPAPVNHSVPSQVTTEQNSSQTSTPHLHRVVPLRRVRWVNDSITGNGTHISLQNGAAQHTYLVAQAQDVQDMPPMACQVIVLGAVQNGSCLHLTHCALRLYADDVNKYLPYFCSIGEFAGTCCTVPELERGHHHH